MSTRGNPGRCVACNVMLQSRKSKYVPQVPLCEACQQAKLDAARARALAGMKARAL